MSRGTPALSEQEFTLANALTDEFHAEGRPQEAALLRKLLALADTAEPAWSDDDLTPEDVQAIERGLGGIAAGKVVPDTVVQQGPAAVRAYQAQRDAAPSPGVGPADA